MALESAPKLKKTSYIHAEGYPAAEMKLDPIDEAMPFVFITTKDCSYEKAVSNIQRVRKGK